MLISKSLGNMNMLLMYSYFFEFRGDNVQEAKQAIIMYLGGDRNLYIFNGYPSLPIHVGA